MFKQQSEHQAYRYRPMPWVGMPYWDLHTHSWCVLRNAASVADMLTGQQQAGIRLPGEPGCPLCLVDANRLLPGRPFVWRSNVTSRWYVAYAASDCSGAGSRCRWLQAHVLALPPEVWEEGALRTIGGEFIEELPLSAPVPLKLPSVPDCRLGLDGKRPESVKPAAGAGVVAAASHPRWVDAVLDDLCRAECSINAALRACQDPEVSTDLAAAEKLVRKLKDTVYVRSYLG